ncbi:hypothetical protein I3842_05G047200 [Carya illinoinensis]|uniref:Sulfotransferase n=1 Tax=Carya illinoinensis TaxID=32201 RepID=A0A922EZ42_CARIL|nr:hypothetical protein I3842_05G047200 [Carya illinoinensis]
MSTLQHDASPRPYNLQEDDELTQECKDFISSLPTEDSLCQYNGFWIPTGFMQGVLAFQKHFQAHDTDILFATSPKVGTTWLKAILFTLVNRMQHHVDCQEHPQLTNDPHVLVPYLDLILHNKKEVPDLTSFTSPRLFSTHLPYVLLPTSVKDSSCKIVYLCRNPKDTFVSLWHFQTKLNWTTDSLEEALDKFCRGVSSFGPYWDNVVGYWKESSENSQKILFLRYEEMKRAAFHPLEEIS